MSEWHLLFWVRWYERNVGDSILWSGTCLSRWFVTVGALGKVRYLMLGKFGAAMSYLNEKALV